MGFLSLKSRNTDKISMDFFKYIVSLQLMNILNYFWWKSHEYFEFPLI